jgi:hypothetical protein
MKYWYITTKIIIYPSFFYHISCKSEDYKYYSRKSKSKLLSTDDVHKETIQQNITQKTRYRATLMAIKTVDKRRWYKMVIGSCSTSVNPRVTVKRQEHHLISKSTTYLVSSNISCRYCPLDLCLLAIALSVLLRFTSSDYTFGIFKLFLQTNRIYYIVVCHFIERL